jgi:hypothetical protein
MNDRTTPELSIVIPVRDEAPNLPLLFDELHEVLAVLGRSAEILFVDDASTDGSVEAVRRLATGDTRVRLLRLARHAGLSAAFHAGFRAARGDVVVTLDADLQNDPRDIPALLAAVADADAATGWRRTRHDPTLRRLSSAVANRVRNVVTGDRIRDSACSLRAIRRSCLIGLPAFDGMHRFLPTLMRAAGYRVVEVPVRHRRRRFGRSHFGIRNRARVTLHDVLGVRWLLSRPLAYEGVEDGEPIRRVARVAPPLHAAGTRSGRVAARLAMFWMAAILLLAGWGALAGPGAVTELPSGTTVVTLFPRPPAGHLVALHLGWEAAPTAEGWAVLEAGEPWSASEAMSWRRRVHAGWNHLVWDAGTLPVDGPVRLRFDAGGDTPWRMSLPRVDTGYRLHHLAPLRGLLFAAVVAPIIAAVRLASRTRRLRVRSDAPWWFTVAAIAGVALWLRLHTLTLQSLWFDEVLTAIGAQDLAWVLYTPQIFGHPPLQYLVAWMVGGAADEWWLRLPSLVAGVATIVAVAALGRAFFGRASGLAAALVLTVSPFHVEISQLARPYALFLLLTVLSLAALRDALDRGRARDWLWFSALLALSLYTHYLAVQVFALEAATAAIFLARRRWRGGMPAVVSFAGASALLLPWAPVLGRLGAAQLGQGDLPAPLLHELVTRVFVPQFLGPGLGSVVGLALLGAALVALRRRLDLAVIALLWLAAPPFVLWLAQPAHFVAGRHLAFALPIVMLLLGHGVASTARAAGRVTWRLRAFHHALPRCAAAVTAAVLVVAWAAPTAEALRDYYQARQGLDWRTVASILDVAVGADERVLASVGALYPLRHYWGLRVEELTSAGFPGPPRRDGARAWIVTHAWDWPAGFTAWIETHAVKVGEVPASWSVPSLEIYRLRGAR